jgi:hypothetical protein
MPVYQYSTPHEVLHKNMQNIKKDLFALLLYPTLIATSLQKIESPNSLSWGAITQPKKVELFIICIHVSFWAWGAM